MSSGKFSVVFGLTADPIHLGHEQAIINGIDYCREQGLDIERFMLIPVYHPNLIADKQAPIASFEHRVAMCRLVAQRLSKQLDCDIQVSEIEKQIAETTGEKSYSFNTIKRMAGEVPARAGMTGKSTGMTKWLFMVSADHFSGRWPKFRHWHQWRELLKYCGLLINQRPGNKINQSFISELKQINPDVFVVESPEVVDVSSSEIRQGFDAKQTAGLLASDVLNYIKEHRLY